MPEGKEVLVGPSWGSDKWRSKISRMAKKGYLKRIPRNYNCRKLPFGDNYVRTSKKWVEGDSPRKPIEFSKQNN